MPTATLHVAIYNNIGVYKHWSLYVDGPTRSQNFIVHIIGSSTNFRYEKRKADPKASSRLVELLTLCEVDASKISSIEAAAQDAVIHNEFPGYNCQDYVIELVQALEKNGVIDGSDEHYKERMALLRNKLEGLM